MPPRRSRSSLRRRPVDHEKENALKQMKQDFDNQIQELKKLYDDVNPDDIFKCKHPFESLNNNESNQEKNRGKLITLTSIQRSITFCILHNGGSATDDEILAFIHRFWPTIASAGQYGKPINKRVLHINLMIAKDNRPLFIKISENRWKLNTLPQSTEETKNSTKNDNNLPEGNNSNNDNSTPINGPPLNTLIPPDNNTKNTQKNTISSRNSVSRSYNSNSASTSNNYNTNTRASTRSSNTTSSRDSSTFQDKIIEILKNAKNQSLTIDEIINKAKEFESLDGIYANLSIDKRVKCVLEAKKILKEVVFDENNSKWFLQTKPIEKQKSFFTPKELKGVRMKDLTLNELWNILKEKEIY